MEKQFNTLVQSGTASLGKGVALVTGKGSDIRNKSVLEGRAKRKLITQTMILSLIDVAKAEGDYESIQSYWNTFHCQNRLITSNGKAYTNYCKNRFCTVCLSIRKADIINRYLPVISQWEEPYFVTLTFKACPSSLLENRIDAVYRAFRKIKQRCNKRHQRGKGPKLVGVKSLECNFNPIKKTYNPHLHLIVKSEEVADVLLKEWLKTWTKKFTYWKAQDMEKVYNNEKALIEIIKYGSKVFTEPDVNNKSRYKKSDRTLYVAALHNIFNHLKGKRLFDRFGFDLPPQERQKNNGITVIEDPQIWSYDMGVTDWIDLENGELLSKYVPTHELDVLLNDHINTSLK